MKLKIFGTTWEIKELGQKALDKKFAKDESLEGYCDTQQQIIYVCKDAHPHRKSVALVHELLHAMFDFTGTNMGEDHEEALIRQQEHHIWELVKNFPRKYLYE
jgi:Zn-dependent peptidase ImmA (M78 family)